MAVLKNITLNSDTSALQLPTGSSAQRPVSPTNGYLRFNCWYEIYKCKKLYIH